jgi:hypothetical protein
VTGFFGLAFCPARSDASDGGGVVTFRHAVYQELPAGEFLRTPRSGRRRWPPRLRLTKKSREFLFRRGPGELLAPASASAF